MAQSRRTWIRLRGVPLHVWDESFFKRFGGLFGELIDFKEETVERKCIEVANMFISTKRKNRIGGKNWREKIIRELVGL